MEPGASAPDELIEAVHDNLRNLGVDALDVVNLRMMGDGHGGREGSIAEPFDSAGRASKRRG